MAALWHQLSTVACGLTLPINLSAWEITFSISSHKETPWILHAGYMG